MDDNEQQKLAEENRQLKDIIAWKDYAYRDLMARVHNAARPNPANEERLAFTAGHYYSEVPKLAELLADAERIWPEHPPRTLPGIDLNEDGQLALLAEIAQFYAEQPWGDERQADLRYYFKNELFSYADALYLYGMLRHLRPRRLIEVGSGYSSAITLDTNERFLGGQLRCTFIDPEPERLYSLLSADDRRGVEILPQRIQDVPVARFGDLAAGDILFLDTSHVTKCDSDVNHDIFEVLPRLAAGVYVHIHDIFYPFEYPRDWLEDGRHWNEDYLIRAFLLNNSAFEVVLFADYLRQFHSDRLGQLLPLALNHTGMSLWLRKR
jgi:Methyltransferase domain